MSRFHRSRTRSEAPQAPDYYFLEEIAPVVSDDLAAHLLALKQAIGEHTITVLSGGLDPRADDNFQIYRDKGHFFAKGTQHRNFFMGLHGQVEKSDVPLTALPLAGYLGQLESYEDYAHSATVYHDHAGQTVYRVDRDETGRVTAINYFIDDQLVRIDSYDHHHRLLMSEQFGAVANLARLTEDSDQKSVNGMMSRTLYHESGRPVFAQTYSPSQLWLLNEYAVPTQVFGSLAGLMAWWLMSQLDGHNRIYLDAHSAIFNQLVTYAKLRPFLVPVIQDELELASLTGMTFPEILLNEGLDSDQFSALADKVTLMPNWLGFKKKHTWSVYA